MAEFLYFITGLILGVLIVGLAFVITMYRDLRQEVNASYVMDIPEIDVLGKNRKK